VDDVKKIDRFFPGNPSQFYPDTGIPEKDDIANIFFAEKDRRGAANGVRFVIYISDIEFAEPESQFEGLAGRSDCAEKDDGFVAAPLVKRDCLHKLVHIAYDDFHLPGDSHTDNRLPEDIGGNQIIDHNNTVSPDIRNPRLEDLTMN
jgi:hypothetical protein